MVRPLVLVVDDDFMVRMNTADTLEEAGFDVIEACNSANALAILKESVDVQLVCTDIQMPGELDGVDLAMRLREHHPHIKVIVTSGFRKRGDLPPGVPFLQKPFVPTRLTDLAWQQVEALNEGCPGGAGPVQSNLDRWRSRSFGRAGKAKP